MYRFGRRRNRNGSNPGQHSSRASSKREAIVAGNHNRRHSDVTDAATCDEPMGDNNRHAENNNNDSRLPSTSSTPESTLPLALDAPADSRPSPNSTPEEMPLDKSSLLELCDSVRRHLRRTKTPGPQADLISFILRRCRHEEVVSCKSIGLSTIKYSHLDKLVAEMADGSSYADPRQAENEGWTGAARFLLRAWRRRYRHDWFMLDENRARGLSKSGRMREVDFCEAGSDVLERWTARTASGVSEVPGGDAEFEPGSWWLNLACAHRDGMVGGAVDEPTRGYCGIDVLPLMKGREEHLGGNMSKYVRVGRNKDMFYSLMTQVGSHTRVLRGYSLKSVLAPSAGVRYDGVFIIRSWGTVVDQTGSKKYTMTVMLERVPGQRPMEEVAMAPWPSQLDDWRLYEQHQAETVRKQMGEKGQVDFRMTKERERNDREQ